MTKRKRESNCHQTTRQHPTSGSTDSFVLSNDLLNHILGFFICPKKGIVDSDSLLACASTCHRWKNASYSQSLWKQLLVPQNDSRSPSHKSSENYKDVIHKALSIKEQGKEFDKDSLSSDLNPIGFVRRRTHTETNDPCTTWYDAVERAHGIPCLLAVSKTTSRHDESYNSRWMIQELYKGMKETLDFLRPMTETDSNKSSTPSSYYPRGIAVINNRIVRWYHGNFQERHSRLRNHRNVTTSSIGNQLSGGVSNLLRLEKSSETLSLDRPRLQMDHWATLVDWIIEIVECFDLKDETAFQAMSFMDRFLFLSPTQVSICAQSIRGYMLKSVSVLISVALENYFSTCRVYFGESNINLWQVQHYFWRLNAVIQQEPWKLMMFRFVLTILLWPLTFKRWPICCCKR